MKIYCLPVLCALAISCWAEADGVSLSLEVPSLPPLEASQQVVATKAVRVGIDTLVYKRVTPPPVSVALPQKNEMVSADDEPIGVYDFPDYLHFHCSIVTYPKGVSEIQWSDDERRQKRVFVHDDLSYLGFSFSTTVERRIYGYTTINYGSTEDYHLGHYPADIQRYIGLAKQVSAGQFVAVPAATGKLHPLTADEADALDVMLAYYQINRAVLKIQQEEAIARAKIEAEAKRIRDLTPKTIELRFWPVKSQRYSIAP